MSHRAVTGRLATAETEDSSFEPRVCIFSCSGLALWLLQKLSSFILFQVLVFHQGENLQEGNFPLGNCCLAQLGCEGELQAGNVEVSAGS